MPPKRKPVQKETKDSEKVATEMSLMSVENKEETIADADAKGIDNPIQEALEALSKPSKKAPAKKQKKPVDIQKATQKETKEEGSDTALVSVENSGGIAEKDRDEIDNPDEDAPSKPSRKAPAKKQKKPINDPKALKDASEDKEGASAPVESVKKEMDKENVEGLKADEKSAKRMDKLSPRRGVKRGAHKADDAPSNPAVKDTSEDKEGADTPSVEQAGKGNVEGLPVEEESLKKTEKVPPRRGAKRGAHKADDAPTNPDDNIGKTGGTEHCDPEENSTIQTEAPKKKRGGKKIIQEESKEKPGEMEDENASVDVDPKQETEALPKKREGRRNVQVPEKDEEPSKKRRGGRKDVQVKEVPKAEREASGDDASNDSNEPVQEGKGAGKKRGAKANEDEVSKKNESEPDEKKSKLEEDNYDCEKESKKGEKWNLKIASWNIAGMRAWVKKSGVDYVTKEDADIICFQETKCPESKVPPEAKVEGYHTFWANSKKDGYAGVALYSKEKPLNVSYGIDHKEHDEEGRVITAEFEKFYLVTTYVPNAGQGLKTLPKRMEWDEIFRNYLKDLDAKKPVILCGDLNVAHEEIDLANPKTNTKHAGFTKEERENMTALLKEGFVDSFRQLYPEKTGCYTFWTYLGNARSRNTGWRLDYFVVSERLMDSVCDVVIRDKVLGSDHCPTTLFIHI